MRPFFHYNAGQLAVDPSRPWQILSGIGVLCGKHATEEGARAAVEALCADKAAGRLPVNLAAWDKAHLLSSKP
jgi:hypothetical protein